MIKFDVGDYVYFQENGKVVFGTVSNVWRSRKSLNIRLAGKSEKVEIPAKLVVKVL